MKHRNVSPSPGSLVPSLLAVALLAALTLPLAAQASSRSDAAMEGSMELKSPRDFASIEDEAARSVALFEEMGKVILHPRCVNCHPAGDVPLQGEDMALHEPPVRRGPDNHGVVGMQCGTCHFEENFEPGEVPGAPNWHLAPLEMAWEGVTLSEICEQLKDPERNGGKTMEEMHEHMAADPLVAWGWEPGPGREPAPGSQQQLGELFRAWLETGAVCP